MKKLGISLLLIVAFAEAAPLPFVGKASFSFTGGVRIKSISSSKAQAIQRLAHAV